MSRAEAEVSLRGALELSHAVAAAADGGNLEATVRLDAERRRLLEAARRGLATLEPAERGVLAEIQALNAQAIGMLQHRQRATARDLDLLAVGRRAVRAYAATRMRR
jgi:hypothetical protein